MKIRTTVIVILTLTLISFIPMRSGGANGGMSVYVIAPSATASLEARKIRQQNGWTETRNVGTADAVLVVARSSRSNPIGNRYDSLEELATDVEDALDVEGTTFHIYLFQLQGNLSVSQTRHISYKAN